MMPDLARVLHKRLSEATLPAPLVDNLWIIYDCLTCCWYDNDALEYMTLCAYVAG